VLRATVEGFEAAAKSGSPGGQPPHVGWMFELFGARAEAEIDWCRRVADRMEAGAGCAWGEDSTSNNQG
jgi:hypothetical protein